MSIDSLPRRGPRSFDDLPGETVTQILLNARSCVKYQDSQDMTRPRLPVASMRVCKQWNSIIMNTVQFWTDIHITSQTQAETLHKQLGRSVSQPLTLWVELDGVGNTEAFEGLALHSFRWQALMIGNRVTVQPGEYQNESILYTGEATRWINSELPNLYYLHIGGLSLSANDGATLTLSLPELRTLSFGWTVPRHHVAASPKLTMLALTSCYIPITNVVRYLVEGASSLKRVTIRNGTITAGLNRWPDEVNLPLLETLSVVSEGYINFLHDLLSRARFPALRSLTYESAGLDRGAPWPSHIPHLDLARLETLDLHGHIFTSDALANVLNAAPRLRVLIMPTLPTLDAAEKAKDVLLHDGLSRLNELHVRGVSMAWLRAIVEALPTIQMLDLTGDGGHSAKEASKDEVGTRAERENLKWLQERVPKIIGLVWTVQTFAHSSHWMATYPH